jgi:hypothetical protein
LALDSAADADILKWLEAQDNQSRAIRAAIRAYMKMEKDVTLQDVYEVLVELRENVSRGEFVPRDGEATDEDPELANALDTLGL